MTYIHNLPNSAARTLALAELQFNPEENCTEYQFDGADVGAGEDEEIVVTYERRKRRSTHPLFHLHRLSALVVPEPEKAP